MNKINLKGVDSSTWIRTLVLIAALINQALVIFDVTENQMDEDAATHYISLAFTFFGAVWSWWKNNSFTKRAQKADETMIAENQSKG